MDRTKIDYAERKISANRKYDLPIEKNRKILDDYMIGAMYDAEKEIAQAFALLTSEMGYATMDLHRTDRAHDESDSYTKEETELMQSLVQLKKNVKSTEYGITIDIAALCFTLDEVSYQRSMARGAILKIFTDALNEWCMIRGYGNQYA